MLQYGKLVTPELWHRSDPVELVVRSHGFSNGGGAINRNCDVDPAPVLSVRGSLDDVPVPGVAIKGQSKYSVLDGLAGDDCRSSGSGSRTGVGLSCQRHRLVKHS